MRHARTALLAVALGLAGSACVTIPEVADGAPFDLPAQTRDQIGLRYVMVQATPAVVLGYSEATDPDYRVGVIDDERETALESDVRSEVENELRRCATGDRLVDATIRVDRLGYDGRPGSLIDGNGIDEMSAVVEFVEPGAGGSQPEGPVVARYRVSVGARSGDLIERVAGDRISHAAEELGRALCMQAFGRNPRPPGIQNSTR